MLVPGGKPLRKQPQCVCQAHVGSKESELGVQLGMQTMFLVPWVIYSLCGFQSCVWSVKGGVFAGLKATVFTF